MDWEQMARTVATVVLVLVFAAIVIFLALAALSSDIINGQL